MVELGWQIADRGGEVIYPSGKVSPDAFRDSCDLPARIGSEDVAYDLHVELEICDPACGDCADPACQVVPTERFPCTRARATEPSVPAAADPYLMTVRPVIVRDGQDCLPPPSCVAAPGPIERQVRAGLVTDLQVLQVVVDVDSTAPRSDPVARLDLVACGCASLP